MIARAAVSAVAALSLAVNLIAASRWEMRYFYDENKSVLILNDLCFPSAQRGFAAGSIVEGSHIKPVVLVTSDEGKTWTPVNVSETGLSLFCLDETACWMVTPKGLWFTSEAGRNWTRVRKEDGLTGVFFLTRERGWIYGSGKKMLATTDGGKTWNRVPAIDALKTSEERTVFHTMMFFDAKTGIVVARSEPLTHHDVPLWMDTEPENVKERPTLTVLLETRDGGLTWKESTTSMFGRITRFTRPAPTGMSLGLIEFDRFFQYPSEVYRYSFGGSELKRSFRAKEVAITDIAVAPSGLGVAAGFEPPGKLARTPVPGRVRMFESTDLDRWQEVRSDYRAVARRVSLSVVDQNTMWIATDTGMILRLVRDGSGAETR